MRIDGNGLSRPPGSAARHAMLTPHEEPKGRRFARGGVWLRLGLLVSWALLAAALAGVGAAEEPVSVDDVVLLLRSGISEATIVAEVRARGVVGPLATEDERRLRRWGATEGLLQVIRERVAPEPGSRPSAKATPPAAEPAAAPPAPTPSFTPAEISAGEPGVVPMFGASAELVRVPVSVTDARGRPVTHLERDDFRVWEQDEPQAVTLFSAERKRLRIAILADVSGSMELKLDEVADALKHFIEVLEGQDEVLVLAFSDTPRVLQDFTSDRRRLGRVLESLRAGGGTALHDALIEGLARLKGTPREASALVFVTDGMDTASESSFGEAKEAARRAEAPVFSIGLGHRSASFHSGRPAGSGADFDAAPLIELAELTGGRAEILPDAEHHHSGNVDRLREAADAIALSLRYRYLLGYPPPEHGPRPGWRAIRVEVERRGLVVHTRKGYYPR